VSITVSDKFTGSGLVEGVGTAPAWDIAVSTYAAGSVTPAANSAVVISTNTVSPEIISGKIVSVRNRSNPQNWMTGVVTAVSGTSVTINTTVAATAKTITRVQVTDSSTAVIYSTSLAVGTYPVGSMVSITPVSATSALIPDAVLGRWYVTASALGSITITGSGFTVADTGTISAANTLLGTTIGFGGTAASGWDINVQSSYHNEVDFWGVQLEPDRGASMFQTASGSPDSEFMACTKYFQALDKVYTLVTSYDTSGYDQGFTQIWYTPKRSVPTLVFPRITDPNYDINWVDGNTESVRSIYASGVALTAARIGVTLNTGSTIGPIGSTGYLNVNAPIYVDSEL
jgi:hypothetical protein